MNTSRPAVREKNVLVHVPVCVEAGEAVFPAIFSPYVWVDNPNSMTGGREVFGYCKSLGQIHIDHPANPAVFALDVFGGNKSDDFWDWHDKFLTIRRTVKTPDPIMSIVDLVGGLGEVGDLISGWADTGVKEIYYKQFRNMNDCSPGAPAEACFCEIITAEYVVFGAESIEPLAHEYEINIAKLDSHPMRTELGLESTHVSAGYRMKTSFRVEHGSVLWTGR